MRNQDSQRPGTAQASVALPIIFASPSFGLPSLCASAARAAKPLRLYSSETAEDCLAIALLGARLRVIDAKDGLQWILQRRDGKGWRSLSIHRERDTLIERSGTTGETLAKLRALPGRHQ